MSAERNYIDGSLLITAELCQKYQACVEGIEFMQANHPNGFTVKDVADKKVRHVPMDSICWGYHTLPFSDEDRRMFLDFASISNTPTFFHSHHLTDCDFISYSHHIRNSTEVHDSSYVDDCYDVRQSQDVTKSTHIDSCREIIESEYCFKSTTVYDSIYVVSSADVVRSYAIQDCQGPVANCNYIRGAKEAENSSFCVGGTHVNHIFCDERCPQDLEYAYLNRPISKNLFERLQESIVPIITEYPYFNRKQGLVVPPPAICSWAKAIGEFWQELEDILPPLTQADREFIYRITLCDKVLKI